MRIAAFFLSSLGLAGCGEVIRAAVLSDWTKADANCPAFHPTEADHWRWAKFTRDQACEWRAAGFTTGTVSDSDADRWRDAGFMAQEAKAWKDTLKVGPKAAASWKQAGISPADA